MHVGYWRENRKERGPKRKGLRWVDNSKINRREIEKGGIN
jgi:hypothetical protein